MSKVSNKKSKGTKEKYVELKIKYDNVERELLRRDKQYKKLLERVNKND